MFDFVIPKVLESHVVFCLIYYAADIAVAYSWIYLRCPLQHSILPSFYLFFPALALERVEIVFVFFFLK